MTDELTLMNKKELREEILGRMDALDTSDEEYSNEVLIKDFEKKVRLETIKEIIDRLEHDILTMIETVMVKRWKRVALIDFKEWLEGLK